VEIVGVVLGGIACVAVWLLIEGVGSGVATSISTAIGNRDRKRRLTLLEAKRREHPGAVVFLASPDGGADGRWIIVADAEAVTAFRPTEAAIWSVKWADVRSLTERFGGIRLDERARGPRLLMPSGIDEQASSPGVVAGLIERMLAQRPDRSVSK
jgi:hypothetical protein